MRSCVLLSAFFGLMMGGLSACYTTTPSLLSTPKEQTFLSSFKKNEAPPHFIVERIEAHLTSYKSPIDAHPIIQAIEQELAKSGLKINQFSRNTQIFYGNLLLIDQKSDQARQVFEDLLVKHEHDKEALLCLVHLSDKQPEQQKTYIEKLRTLFPGDPEIAILQGQIHLASGNAILAQEAFEASLQHSENSLACLKIAEIAKKSKNWDQALFYLNRAEKVDSQNPQIFADRAQIYQEKTLYFDAEKDINKALVLQPDNNWYILDRARLYWLYMYKPQQALEDLYLILNKDPENFFAHVYKAEILDVQDQVKPSWEAYQTVLKLSPEYRHAYPAASVLAFHFKQWERAQALAEKAWQDHSGEYAFPLIMALSLRFMGEHRKAKTVLEAALKKFLPGTAVAECVRFLLNPRHDYYLNEALNKEKNEVTRCRLRFYQGCQFLLDRMPSSAKNTLIEVSEYTLKGIPEIRIAKTWLEDFN